MSLGLLDFQLSVVTPPRSYLSTGNWSLRKVAGRLFSAGYWNTWDVEVVTTMKRAEPNMVWLYARAAEREAVVFGGLARSFLINCGRGENSEK